MLAHKLGLGLGVVAICGAATWAATFPSSSAPGQARARPAAPQHLPATPVVVADAADDEAEARRLRCANRLAIAFTGYTPSDALLAAADPQAQVDALLASDDFKEHFARFINSRFQPEPGVNRISDAVYYTVRYVLDQSPTRPWSDVFIGKYDFDLGTPGDFTTLAVRPSQSGLGYFRSKYWLQRYYGNENEQGLRLVSAYRILQNTLGLELVPSTNGVDADISASGRMNAPCNGCHFNGPLPLDPIAGILSRRHKQNGQLTQGFDPPPPGASFTVDGITVHDDAELVTMLVKSKQFQFNACRLAFQFLYGRAEHSCEGPLFDECMDAFAPAGTAIEDGKIQDAIRVVAKDPSFCQ